jgi:ABC-type branched-subunit amino acid transport system ATPase component
MSTATLRVRDVWKSFGGVHALRSAWLEVKPGGITALIGPNGSGKTSLFNCITGFYVPDSGEIFYGETQLNGRLPNAIVHLGIARTFQVTRIFKRMTVLENMIVPVRQPGFKALFSAAIKGHERERALDLLQFVGLAQYEREPAANLSFGQQKLLELAAALMAQPDLMLLDEPAGGMNPIMIDRLIGYVQQLNANGMTFLLVEHNMGFVMRIAQSVAVMHRGNVIVQGEPEAVRSDSRVLDAYLGD